MKVNKTARWIVTALASALMVLSAAPDVLRVPGAVMIFGHLGYPTYLLPFLGTAKLLGVGVVLAPGLPKLKEWAFAGLTFDLVGALYSHLSIGDPPTVWLPAGMGLILVSAAYGAHRLRMERTPDSSVPSAALAVDSDQIHSTYPIERS